MCPKWNAVLVVVSIAIVSLATIVHTLPPSPLPSNAPAAEFSAERAIEHIRVIAARPRLTGSPAYEDARNYVISELNGLGLETETHHSNGLRNTIGWIRGHSSSEIIVLTAHLDTVAESPGAADDGSGVAVLLETARALMSSEALRNTVMFLFTDNEEGGMVGAKAFVDQHPSAKDIKLVIGYDAGGSGGPAVLSATSINNGWLVRHMAHANPYIVGSSAINALASSRTDFTGAFKEKGYSGFEFDLYWDPSVFHSSEDTVENLNPASVQHQGFHALSLVRYFGSLEQLTDPRESDAIFFNVLRLFTIAYSSFWAIPLAIIVSGVFIFALMIGFRKNLLNWRGIGYGIFVLLAALIIAPLPDLILATRIHPIIARLIRPSLQQVYEVSVMVIISITLIFLWLTLSQRIRPTSPANLIMGGYLLITVGMIVSAIVFPALSFGFTWPLLINLLASMNWFYRSDQPIISRTVAPELVLSAALTIIVVGPTILLGLFDQMTLALVFLGALCWILIPQILYEFKQ